MQPEGENHDLWDQLTDLVAQTRPGQIDIRYVGRHHMWTMLCVKMQPRNSLRFGTTWLTSWQFPQISTGAQNLKIYSRERKSSTTFGSNDFRHYEASTCKSQTQPKKIKKSLISLMNPLLWLRKYTTLHSEMYYQSTGKVSWVRKMRALHCRLNSFFFDQFLRCWGADANQICCNQLCWTDPLECTKSQRTVSSWESQERSVDF